MQQKNFPKFVFQEVLFFDLNEIRNKKGNLPNMMPSTDDFEVYMSQIGLKHDDLIIVYDSLGISSAPRVWYLLKVFGAKNVAILNGGFPIWRKEGRPIEEGPMSGTYHSEKQAFTVKYSARSVANIRTMMRIITGVDNYQIVDCRESDKFNIGHIPGAINITRNNFVSNDGFNMQSLDILRKIFISNRVDYKVPIVSMSDNGINACIINYALHLIQCDEYTDDYDLSPPLCMYDAGWLEWESYKDLPIANKINDYQEKQANEQISQRRQQDKQKMQNLWSDRNRFR